MNPRRARRCQAGAAAVELALVLLPVLLVSLATAEFGYLLSRYHSLNKRVHDATRYLSGFDPVGDASYASRVLQAKSLVEFGNTDASGNASLGELGSRLFTCDRHAVTAAQCPASASASPLSGGLYTVSVGISNYLHEPLFASSSWVRITLPTVMATLPQGY